MMAPADAIAWVPAKNVHRMAADLSRAREALRNIQAVVQETHEGKERAYTALSMISGLARDGLADANVRGRADNA